MYVMHNRGIERWCIWVVFFSLIIVLPNNSYTQTMKEIKMKALSFMIGEWVGTSTILKAGDTIDQIPAYQRIRYDLDSNIIVIDLKSESLQLHTIIYYDENEDLYYYNPFSKSDTRKLPAQLIEGSFVVYANKSKRFIFGRTEEGFCEYGEIFIDGKWEKYFEDNFLNIE